VDGLDLYLLGRELTKIAEASFERAGAERPPLGLMLVLEDVVGHPDSSISEITKRTGFPQSHVSSAVARFRERGIVETRADEHDARRTIVRAKSSYVRAARRRGTSSADQAITEALGAADPTAARDVIEALERVARLLSPDARHRTQEESC
jgi:DNA-binding MarR family transcriptional regulator